MQYKTWIGKQELEQRVSKSDRSHVLIFAAKWCGYCNRFLQIVDAYAATPEPFDVLLVDTDSGDGSLWEDYDINVVPTIVVYRDGKQMFKKQGRFGAGLGVADLEEALKEATAWTGSSDARAGSLE